MNNQMIKHTKTYVTYRILLIVMFVFAIGGFIAQAIYKNSPKNAIPINDVNYLISVKEQKADKKIAEIENLLSRNSLDSLRWIPFEKLTSTYLVFRGSNLIFWSDNHIQPEDLHFDSWQYILLSNTHAIARSRQVGEFNIVAYIPIKYNYPYQNSELVNEYTNGFELDKEVNIVQNKPADKYAVFNNQNEYLFTLELPATPIYNELWAKLAMVLFLISFLLLFYLYARFPSLLGKTTVGYKSFFAVSGLMTLFVFACLLFDFPSTFFQNKIFTSYHYASSSFLATLTHLSFITFFLCAVVFLYCFYLKKELKPGKFYLLKKTIILLIPGVYFLIIFSYLKGLIFNSSTEINILRLDDFTLVSIWNHFLFLFWGLSFMLLHLKTHNTLIRNRNIAKVIKLDCLVALIVCGVSLWMFGNYGKDAVFAYIIFSLTLYLPHFIPELKKSKWFLVIWLFILAFVITFTSIRMNRDKKYEKYRTLAENHYINENSEEDKFAELMLEDLDKEIVRDVRLLQLIQFPDSVQTASEYLNDRYLRGFWKKYEMRLFTSKPGSDLDHVYLNLADSLGNKIKKTHFFIINNPQSDILFLGIFKQIHGNAGEVNFYMEFYPQRNYKSYSFPDLLIETPGNIQTQLSLSTGRYKYRQLVYSSGKFKYPRNGNWIEKKKSNYFTQNFSGFRHYIYAPDIYNYLVISEKNIQNTGIFLLYFFYVFMIYLCSTLFVIWLYKVIHKKTNLSFGLTQRFLYSFIILLLVSFLSIFYVSINYTRQKYRDEQKQNLEQRKNFIQSALQEKYYWTQHLDSGMTNALNFDLQDLSYVYQTDIHVYDNRGVLIGSSQPTIFTKNLISKQISPLTYFAGNPNMNTYEHIGNLEYLTAYTDFYNGDFLQIGYIAVPQFLSQDQIRQDIESFLSVIVNIYLIIIFMFIFLTLFIGKRLSAPLTMLENRLKEIQLGQRNEKIEYKPNDEIGQLVAQYNRTVDELERSAKLLAKSERESAWKTMARQVAHEINNPLTPMKLTIQQLQRTKAMKDDRFDAYFEKSTATLIEQIENLSRIAGTFSNFARLPETKLTEVDVAKKLKSVVELFAENHENVKIRYEGQDSGVIVMADREQIIQVFNNLLKNAIQSIPSERQGIVNVKLRVAHNQVHIYFEDNGKGVPEEIKDKLFTPNFTTKSTGMGLGLAICENIIHLLDGEIIFETELNKGTVFHIVLPAVVESV